MNITELRKVLAPIAEELDGRADEVEADGFSPWTVGAIRDAADLLRTLDNGRRE